MEEATKKALDLIEQSAMFAKHFIEKHGPQAWDTVLWVYRIKALNYLLTGLVCAVASYLWFNEGLNLYREEVKKHPEAWWLRKDWYIAAYAFATLLAVPGYILLLDIWNYVTLIWPELTVAKDVFEKVVK